MALSFHRGIDSYPVDVAQDVPGISCYFGAGLTDSPVNGTVVNNYTSFDGDGRVLASNVQMRGQTYNFSYSYDLAGELVQGKCWDWGGYKNGCTVF